MAKNKRKLQSRSCSRKRKVLASWFILFLGFIFLVGRIGNTVGFSSITQVLHLVIQYRTIFFTISKYRDILYRTCKLVTDYDKRCND